MWTAPEKIKVRRKGKLVETKIHEVTFGDVICDQNGVPLRPSKRRYQP